MSEHFKLRGTEAQLRHWIKVRAEAGELEAITVPRRMADGTMTLTATLAGDVTPPGPLADIQRPPGFRPRRPPTQERRRDPAVYAVGAIVGLVVLGLAVWGALALWAWVQAHVAQVVGWGLLLVVVVGTLASRRAAREKTADGCRWLLVHLCGGGR